MKASDKAHLRLAASRGECTPEFAEQVIMETEEAERLTKQLADWIGAPYIGPNRAHDETGNFKQCAAPGMENAPCTIATNGTGRI